MDTLSSSVSTLKVPTLHSISTTTSSRELNHFKSYTTNTPYTPNLTPHTHLFSSTTTTTKPINSISSTKPTSFTIPIFPSPPPSPATHRSPAAGYAAALFDVAQLNNSVDLMGKDVERLSKLLRSNRVRVVLSDPFLGEEEKGRVVKGLAEKGRFNRHLVCLVKILVGRKKVGALSQVLDVFERVYDAVLGTQVV
ncbi:ATPase, OSCP/delta subunit [Parasponia andersonii]|uniref:ATPase, OSCP/delta subunit n=1 Tax=Parasponia andersonii TaxID=3476 RepID=A0A2P5DQ91_PARAD|nr:ATPase, OSCP/delta subunit [Parasponia andersonii]